MSLTYHRELIVGAPGTGKSYTLRQRVAARLDERDAAGVRSRLVVFDPMGEFNPRGALRVGTRRDFLRALETERFPLVVEAVFEDWSPLDVFYDLVVMADELHNYASAHGIHPSQRRLFCESRKRRCDLFVATQRPNHMNPIVLSTATRARLLPIQHREDRKAIEAGLSITLPPVSGWRRVDGVGNTNPLARLPFVWPDDFDENGCVSLGTNPK